MSVAPTKTCVSCGRTIEWRKKWARSWEDVRYCSEACRRRRVTDEDRRLEDVIRTLLAGRSGSVSAADVVRTAGGKAALVEPVKRAARRLVASGEVEIVQHGQVVDPSTAKGIFEIRRR